MSERTCKTMISKVDYFDIKEGDQVVIGEFVQAPKGACSFYKCTPIFNNKIHYMYTAELAEWGDD